MSSALVRGIAAITTLTAPFLGVQPAEAASGGGCSAGPIGACISYSNGYAVADFYQNAAGDSSMCYARMEVQTSNVGTKWSRLFDIRSHNGRYGPFLVNVNTQPASHGRAFNHVHVYNCAGNPHYIATSPAVYYP